MAFSAFILVALAVVALQLLLRHDDDRQMATRLRDRDPHVMGDLYRRYGRVVYSIVFRVVRNTGTAEDLTQETFLRVWTRGASCDPDRGSLGPWIVTIARNRAIDHVRMAESRIAESPLDIGRLELPAAFCDLDANALSLDRVQRLRKAFSRLNENQREAIELAYYEGLSQTEMAERMQQPLGTVKTWVRSELKIMREELQEAATA